MGERKGSYDLLKAIPDILKVIPDAHFYLGGDGDIVKSQKLIDENGIQNHVKLLGWVRNEEKEIYLKNVVYLFFHLITRECQWHYWKQ